MIYIKIALVAVLLLCLGIQTYRVQGLQKDIVELKFQIEQEKASTLEKRSKITRFSDDSQFFDGLLQDPNW